MRFLFLNHNLKEHGTWFRAFHLARELVRRGHTITLLTVSPEHWYRPVEYEQEGARIVEAPSWSPMVGPDDGWGPIDIAYRLGRVLSEEFDLLYAFAHPPNIYLPARLAQALRRKPMVADWCDVYRDGIFPLREEIRAYRRESGFRLNVQRRAEQIEKRLERAILRRADGVTVISDYLRREALKEGVDPQRLLRYPSGANTEAIAPRRKAECRALLDIDEPGPFLVYVANYNPDERFFLKALARAFGKNRHAKLIAAAPPFTDSLVRECGLRDRIIALGRRPFEQMNIVLGAADVTALPLDDNTSNRGRWPNKFGDYLAAGRPIATNAIGDVADYFPANGEIGGIGVAAPCDAEAYGDAIAGLLEREGDWEAMGESARRLAETRLGWANLAVEVEAFLLRIMEMRAAG